MYYADNTLKNTAPKVQVISICALEDLTGINIFPQLTEDQKRNTYNLPLRASAVKATQKIAYSYWDAESNVPRRSVQMRLALCRNSLNLPL